MKRISMCLLGGLLFSLFLGLQGCNDNKLEVSPEYQKLTPEEQKARLKDTMDRHNGKMKPFVPSAADQKPATQ